MAAVREALKPFVGAVEGEVAIIGNWTKSTPEPTDGGIRAHVTLDGDKLHTPVLLMEGKLDLGSGGNAILQGVVAYCKLLGEHEGGGAYCNQPCILLAVEGMWMFVYGLVVEGTGTVHVGNLSALTLAHTYDAAIIKEGTRKMVALRSGITMLQTDLGKLMTKNKSGALHPYPISGLTYKARRKDCGPLLYDGEYHGANAVVKFTCAPICPEAQNLLAEAGYAPKVLYTTQVWESTWYATVMEEVAGAITLEKYMRSEGITTVSAQAITVQLQSMLSTLHSGDFVHGDILPRNILVREIEGSMMLSLVDFEWAGKSGEACFPCEKQDLGMSLITKTHDEHAVAAILRALQSVLQANAADAAGVGLVSL